MTISRLGRGQGRRFQYIWLYFCQALVLRNSLKPSMEQKPVNFAVIWSSWIGAVAQYVACSCSTKISPSDKEYSIKVTSGFKGNGVVYAGFKPLE